MGFADVTPNELSVLMPIGFAISFSGRIASGKTTITQTLSDVLRWRRVGFSDYLRHVFEGQGSSDPTREQLQDLGQSLVAKDPDQFCRDVLALGGFSPGENIILDGIRHADIQSRLARLVKPSRAVLIHLAASGELARQRVEKRGASDEEFRRASEHAVEQDLLKSLPSCANHIVDAALPLLDVVSRCIDAMNVSGVDEDALAQARDRLGLMRDLAN